MSRVVIGVASVLLLALAAGLERVGTALAAFTPAGSFEAQCAALPPAGVTVRIEAARVLENRVTPFEALTRLSEGPSREHRTIGLTVAHFGHRATTEMKGLADARLGRACVRPQVAVEFYVDPLTVYVAREYSGDPCRARVIRAHEQRHVDVYVAYAREAAAQLREDLVRVVGDAPHFAGTIGEAQAALDRRLGAALDGFMREAQRTLVERQAEVDSPEEYERVRTACQSPG